MTNRISKTLSDGPPLPALATCATATLLIISLGMLAGCSSPTASPTGPAKVIAPGFEAEAAQLSGGAVKLRDATAPGKSLVALSGVGQSVQFNQLPAASKLALRYATTNAGTINVAVNGGPMRKVNVHSSGAFTNSFLHAIMEVAIPAQATLTVSVATNDVAVNLDRIVVGDGDLGLPPDIWNLPPLPFTSGPYAADWKAMSRIYAVPEWWRDAKFGAWSHWTPQSLPEQGDWYARGTGDFTNDLTLSDTPGDVWSSAFNGTSVSVMAPKEPGAGKIEVQIDGQTRATADLSTTGPRQAQQTVWEITGLTPGNHQIAIINRGPGPVALDALIVR